MNRTLPTVNRFSRLPSPLALALFGLVLAACGCASAALQDGSYSTKTSSVDVHTAQVRVDVEEVWYVAQDVFGVMSSEPLRITEFPRTLHGKVDSGRVTIQVLAFDLNRTTIKVGAKRLGFSDSRIATRVLETLLAKIEERNPGF